MNYEEIKKVTLDDIVKDLKVLRKVCYPIETLGVNCKQCESYLKCYKIFGGTTPKLILDKLKEGTE